MERITREELRSWRRRLGITQAELARLLGVSRNTLARWEWGKHPVPPWIGAALAGIEATEAHLKARETRPKRGRPPRKEGGDAR